MWLVLVGVCAALAGCGGEEVGTGASAEEAEAVAAPERSEDERAAAEMALRYLDAVVEKDWEAACETRSSSEREEFARMAGSCERMYKVLFQDKPVDRFDGVEAGEVRIERDVAGVDVHQKGQEQPVTTLAVVRTDGGWYLEAVPDATTP
jgi:hypothetical protein